MDVQSISQLTPETLARFLSLDFPIPWAQTDGPAALRHQLEAPLFPDVTASPVLNKSELEEFLTSYAGPKVFGEQLTTLQPSIKLLVAIKLFAKHSSEDVSSPLQGNAATVLYFAAIGAALIRCNQRITQLSDPELKKGFDWAKQQSGAETLRPLFETALSVVCPPLV